VDAHPSARATCRGAMRRALFRASRAAAAAPTSPGGGSRRMVEDLSVPRALPRLPNQLIVDIQGKAVAGGPRV